MSEDILRGDTELNEALVAIVTALVDVWISSGGPGSGLLIVVYEPSAGPWLRCVQEPAVTLTWPHEGAPKLMGSLRPSGAVLGESGLTPDVAVRLLRPPPDSVRGLLFETRGPMPHQLRATLLTADRNVLSGGPVGATLDTSPQTPRKGLLN